MFNGSADLRQAAGQLIEETAKAARRKKEMNDAFLETLYGDMTSLYHLDQIAVEGESQEEREETEREIPAESRVLLGAIAVIWILIGIYRFAEARKEARKAAKKD